MPDAGKTAAETVRAFGPSRGVLRLAAVALMCLVWVVFWPILGFPFVDLDVNDQLVNNVHVHGLSLENIKYILTSKCVSSYYPVRTLTLAMDYQVWGLTPVGFKLTNGLFHSANVLLIYWLILRLFRHPAAPRGTSKPWHEVGMAAFAAGIVAVHPVTVEPVTWVGGREELLMTLGAVCCFHFHLSASLASKTRSRRTLGYRVGAAVFCAVACLSNAIGAIVPLLITAWYVLTCSRPRFLSILGGTVELWLMGVATIVIKQVGYTGDTIAPLAPVFSFEWLMLVLRTYWLNLATLVYPSQLGVLYEWVRPQSLLEKEVVLGTVAVALTMVVLWRLRRQRLMLFGLIWFGLALAPSSQLMLHHVARADRYLYLPLMGLAMAGGLALRHLGHVTDRRVIRLGAMAMGGALLILFAALSSSQIQTWRSSTALWEQCVRVAPNNPMAIGCLADNLARDGQFEEAIPYYESSLQIDPVNLDSLNNYAIHLATWQDERLRNYELAIQLAERACEISDWEDSQMRRTLAKACANYAKVFHVRGQYRQSIEYCRTALEADPQFEAPMFNLALLLATCPDEALRRPEEAVQLAERAIQLSEGRDPIRLTILSDAYAAAGRFDHAARMLDQAIVLAEAAGDTALVEDLKADLRKHQARIPDQRVP